MTIDPQLLGVLRQVKVPQSMPNRRAFVDYLITHAQAGTKSETPEEGLRRINEVMALLIGSQLDVIHALHTVDEQLRTIGERLKQVGKPQG
jgi:hypothetical protein